MAAWFRVRPDGLDLFVRLTPKASKDAVEGEGQAADGSRHLLARVRAVPEKGAANAALERLLAKHFGLPKSAVGVVAGATARLKTVRLVGDPVVLERMIAGRMANGETSGGSKFDS